MLADLKGKSLKFCCSVNFILKYKHVAAIFSAFVDEIYVLLH